LFIFILKTFLFEGNDRPDLNARIFRIKLESLLDDLTKKSVLGKVISHIHVIEFQKRGLPHAHILLILADQDKPRNTDDYDNIVKAELPDKNTDPELYEIIKRFNVHGMCGILNKSASCMEKGTILIIII
jgi:hypothetical protein